MNNHSSQFTVVMFKFFKNTWQVQSFEYQLQRKGQYKIRVDHGNNIVGHTMVRKRNNSAKQLCFVNQFLQLKGQYKIRVDHDNNIVGHTIVRRRNNSAKQLCFVNQFLQLQSHKTSVIGLVFKFYMLQFIQKNIF